MHIHRLAPTDPRDVRRYVDFPFRLYRNQPLWVPPIVSEARAQLDPQRHPFYEHSQAAFFLAMEGEEVVGRIAVLDNARYNAHHGARTGFFYQFDSVEDRAVSRALFDAGCDWARSRGLERMWGPKGFLQVDGQGVLCEGFEHRPALGVPYNFPYYEALLEDAGFSKTLDFLSWYMDRQFHFPDEYLEVAAKIKQRRGFRSVVFRDKAGLRALIPKVTLVYNQSFGEVQGYVPMTEAEAQMIGRRILSVADPELISFLFKEDELIGFVMAYPDISAALQRCRGRIWPTGWYHLMREFRRTRWINFNGMGIVERHRGLGGNALLYAELYRILIDHPRYDFGDLVQIQETNLRMVQEMQAVMGIRPYKRHRIYEKSIA